MKIYVVRICSHNVMLVLAEKKNPELASAVVAIHFGARWSKFQKKQMEGYCVCV